MKPRADTPRSGSSSLKLGIGVVLLGVIPTAILLALRDRDSGLVTDRPATERPTLGAEDDRSYLAVLEITDPRTNDYLNLRRAEMLAAQSRATAAPRDRFRLFHISADELVKGGDPAGGLQRLSSLFSQIPDKGSEVVREIESAVRWSIAVAALRLGELENCLQENCCDSCVFPIGGAGVHVHEAGSRRAIAEVEWLLAHDPSRMDLVWLRNLLAMTLGEWPDQVPEKYRIAPDAFASDYKIPRFMDVASQVGVDVIGLSGGSCLEDFDGDGNLDLFVTSWGPEDQARFFRADGNGKFEDRTAAAGVAGITGGLNCIHADYDNDGDADILILRGAWLARAGRHPNTLLRNDGGRFVDVTLASGILSHHPTQTAAWGDYDLDGDLDIYIGNESVRDDPHPCELFENRGDGTFVEVAASAGVAHTGFVKGVVWGDIDNDGDLDLYLSVIAGRNLLYENLGAESGKRPRFREIGEAAAVTEPDYSFPTWMFDFDQDGLLDILAASFDKARFQAVVADYLGLPAGEGIRLYRNLGGGKFADVSQATGLRHPILPMGSNFGDIDGDGWLDLFFGTGEPEMASLVPNRVFRNDGGVRFQDVTTSGGFGHLQKGHGIAFGDIDHDGDQDIFATMGGAYEGDTSPSVLYENPMQDHRWLTLHLEGTRSSRDAHDARVRIEIETPDGPRTLHRVIGTGGSFGSSSLQLEVGLGNAIAIRGVTIHWPVSGESHHTGFELDHAYRIREGDAAPISIETTPFRLGSS